VTPVATLRFIVECCNDVADGLSTSSGQVTLGCPLLAQSGHCE